MDDDVMQKTRDTRRPGVERSLRRAAGMRIERPVPLPAYGAMLERAESDEAALTAAITGRLSRSGMRVQRTLQGVARDDFPVEQDLHRSTRTDPPD
ncbi:hypothetical protein [Burkholderia ubonensis]|uniref:hypothetical protein n=1 Tax=Burkholderia ubonensis TaxID=101571 RepID=UPI0018DF55C4|nr:hypothetical protein [Burkholderia ubonensis]